MLFKKIKLSAESPPNALKLVPQYLYSLMPNCRGVRTNYVLRNSNRLDVPKTRLVNSYNSFLPSVTREWNSLLNRENYDTILGAPTITAFKSGYKRLLFRQGNLYRNIEHEDGNIHQTRLRLGLSPLRAQLYYYNLIADPVCQFCRLEPETVDHYVLRCPYYNVQRISYLLGIGTVLDMTYIASLDDATLVNIFLDGDPNLPSNTNVELFRMAQSFISSTRRFDLRMVR